MGTTRRADCLFFHQNPILELTMSVQPVYTITLSEEQYDAEQINLMEERLILLSNDDEQIGEGSKKDCKRRHTQSNLIIPFYSYSILTILLSTPRSSHPTSFHRSHQITSPPRLLRFPLPPHDGQTAASEEGRREDYVPWNVDQHVLLASSDDAR